MTYRVLGVDHARRPHCDLDPAAVHIADQTFKVRELSRVDLEVVKLRRPGGVDVDCADGDIVTLVVVHQGSYVNLVRVRVVVPHPVLVRLKSIILL